MKLKNEYSYILNWHKKIKSIELLGGKCQKCGEERPWLLVFHHKNKEDKEFTINKIKDHKWNFIKKELNKCLLLCHNCHRKIHSPNNENRETKSKKIILDLKIISGCEVCGYDDYLIGLDFHHTKDKLFRLNTGSIRIGENSCNKIKNKIIEEINKCKVLCANCHQDLHFDKEKFEKYKNEIYNWEYKELKEPLNKELVMKLYNEGMKQIDIAKKFGRNKSIICGIIKKLTL
jgi:hypothetical protein